MDPLLAYVLIVVGLAVMAGELLLPTAGVLFGLGLTAVIVALAILFHADPLQGAVTLIVVSLVLTVLGPLALRLWRATPLGRRLTLDAPPEMPASRREKVGEGLLHRCGKAVSPHRPAGVAEFDGRRVETISEGPFIEAGCWVRCVAVKNGRIIVRPLDAPPELMDVDPDDLKF